MIYNYTNFFYFYIYMSNYFVVVPVGYHCATTYVTQNLKIKKETGLFEWLISQKLDYVSDLIIKINKSINSVNITQRIFDITINETITTSHYKANDYKEIFNRRAKRFLNLIRNNNNLIFLRINPLGQKTTENEINRFLNVIKSINPSVNPKFLLVEIVDKVKNFKELNYGLIPSLCLHRHLLSKKCPDEYLGTNMDACNYIGQLLRDLGYNNPEMYHIEFTEHN